MSLVRSFDRLESQFSEFEAVIRSIPRGKVATYGQVAEAAGYPRHHRAVAKFLSAMAGGDLPWQRVLGACGEIKTRGRIGSLQRKLLLAEGVAFIGAKVDFRRHEYSFDD